MSEVERKTKEILEKSKFGLSNSDIDNACEFIAHGEYGIAFELICNQLYENDTVIESDLIEKIQDTAISMRLESSSWEFLKKNVKR